MRAQFERRQISERVLANFDARAQRGLYNGGSVPVGFRLHPEKKGYLLVGEEQASVVRDVLKTFLERGSMAEAGKALNGKPTQFQESARQSGRNPRLGYFSCGNIYQKITGRVVRDHKREQEVITKVQDLRQRGFSYWKIAAILNAMKVPTKTRRGRWHARSVQMILEAHKP